MQSNTSVSRRRFLSDSARLAAGGAVLFGMPSFLAAGRSPNDTITFGIVGVGNRGKRLLQEALAIPKIRVTAVCDVYEKRFAEAKEIIGDQPVTMYHEYRHLLDQPGIDAVIVATPDHLHQPIVTAAAEAGKDIYAEKCMTRTLDEAKKLVRSIKENGRVYQLGHNLRSRMINHRSKAIFESGALGKITYIHAYHHRNSNRGEWRWYLEQGKPEASATLENIRWDLFLENTRQRDFDPYRFLNWRCFWDYGTGIAGDLLSHSLDSINQVCGMGIPKACYAQGGIHYWYDGREVPDVYNVIYEFEDDRDLSISYNCNFNNNRYGWGIEFYGKDAFMELGSRALAVYPQRVSERYKEWFEKQGTIPWSSPPWSSGERPVIYQEEESVELATQSHMLNFFDCMRDRGRTRCNEDDGFEEAVTAIMSVKSYQEKRRVIWDSEKQELV